MSNAIGSNIFDILVGLGLPWLLSILFYHDVKVESDGLFVSIILLMGGLFLYLVVLCAACLTLYKWSGIFLILAYAVWVIWEVAAEVFDIHLKSLIA